MGYNDNIIKNIKYNIKLSLIYKMIIYNFFEL